MYGGDFSNENRTMTDSFKMSQEHEKLERLRDRMLQCPICMDEYKDPRMLPCHHTVCLNCLLDFVHASSSSGRLFRCPQCRADVCVPRGGVKDFPPNFYINCIQDEIGSKPYFGICDVCERDWLVSQYRCIDCDVDVCKFCVHDHRLFKHMSGRQPNIIRIETGNIGQNLTSEKFCEHHKDESLQMFCVTCDTPVCVTCVCDMHKKHDTMTLAKKLQLARKYLQFDLDKLQIDVKEVKATLGKLRDLEKEGGKSADEAVCMIQEHKTELVQQITKLAEEKINTIDSMRGKYVKEIRDYETELSAYLDHLQRGASFLGDLQEEDMCLELLTCFQKYKKVADSTEKSVVNKTIRQNKFLFTPGKVLNKCGFFGVGRGVLKKMEEVSVLLPRVKARSGIQKYVSFRRMLGWLVIMMVLLSVVAGFVQFGQALTARGEVSPQLLVSAGLYTFLCLVAFVAYWKS